MAPHLPKTSLSCLKASHAPVARPVSLRRNPSGQAATTSLPALVPAESLPSFFVQGLRLWTRLLLPGIQMSKLASNQPARSGRKDIRYQISISISWYRLREARIKTISKIAAMFHEAEVVPSRTWLSLHLLARSCYLNKARKTSGIITFSCRKKVMAVPTRLQAKAGTCLIGNIGKGVICHSGVWNLVFQGLIRFLHYQSPTPCQLLVESRGSRRSLTLNLRKHKAPTTAPQSLDPPRVTGPKGGKELFFSLFLYR